MPLLKALSEKYQAKITIAVQAQCADAFINIPWIDKILHIPDMEYGIKWFQKNNYITYQATNNIKFPQFRAIDPNHSLIDTQLNIGLEFGLSFDHRPMFFPTKTEAMRYQEFDSRPTIAIESFFKSAQSWADLDVFNKIVNRYRGSHRILWLSNRDALDGCDNLLRYTRREIIMLLQLVDVFFSVGSGFFCGSLALKKELQPRRIVCMFNDHLYNYKNRLNELQWHNNICWVANKDELDVILNDSKLLFSI